jgi:hypothetical protein
MKLTATVAVSFSLALLTSCGSSSYGGSSSIIPPVGAQSGYSNASISGTYSVSLAAPNTQYINGTTPGDTAWAGFNGSLTADGNGNISSGALTEHFGGSASTCALTISGTYTLSSTAGGTATLNVVTSNPSGPCFLNGTLKFSVQAGQQGESLFLVESDGLEPIAGAASKQ